jgi:hypothetical protein
LKHVNDTVHARGEVIKGDNLSYSSFGKWEENWEWK